MKEFERLGLSYNPFGDLNPNDPKFEELFVDREKELGKLELVVASYKNGVRKNTAVVGEPRIGKTTLLMYFKKKLENCVFFKFPPKFKDFAKSFGVETSGDLRDIGNELLLKLEEKSWIVIIDNFEEMLKIDDREFDEYVRIFRRSNALFIAASTLKEWRILCSKTNLKYAFPEEVYLERFDLEHVKTLIESRLKLARVGDHPELHPFTEEAVRLLAVYSFYVPGKVVDLASRVLIEAAIEGKESIDAHFVKRVVLDSLTIGEYIRGLSDREVKTLELLMEAGRPLGFEELSKKLGVSRVTVGEYLQKLIDRGLVEEVGSFGKMKRYVASEKLKTLI